MRNKLLTLFLIFLSTWGIAQCELTGDFEYSTDFPGGVIYAGAFDDLDVCPDADSLNFEWRLDGNPIATDSWLQYFIGGQPGQHVLCLIVRAYSGEEQIAAEDMCMDIVVPNCNIQGTVITQAQNEGEVVFVAEVWGGTPPYTFYWQGSNGQIVTTQEQLMVFGNPTYPFIATVQVADVNGCQSLLTGYAEGPQTGCDYSFTYVLDQNLISITEYLNGEPMSPDAGSVFYTAGGLVYSSEHNPSFYLPSTGTFEVCGTIWSGGCQSTHCETLVVSELESDCEAFFTVGNFDYQYNFSSQNGGFTNQLAWYVDGEFAGSSLTLYNVLEPGEHTVVLVVSNSITGCSDEYSVTVDVPEPIILCGYAFEDLNENGIMDEGEPGVEGVEIMNGSTDSTITDVNGFYEIEAHPGAFYIQANSFSTGYAFLNSLEDTWAAHDGEVWESMTTCDLNWPMESYLATVCGVAFQDVNANGIMDDGEEPLSNVLISQYTWNNQETTWEPLGYSNENGEYCFVVHAGYNFFQGTYVTTSGLEIDVPIEIMQILEPGDTYSGADAAFYFVADAVEVGIALSTWNNATPGFLGYYNILLNNDGTLPAVIDVTVHFPSSQSVMEIGQIGSVSGVLNSSTNTVTWSDVNIDGLGYLNGFVYVLNAVNTPLGATVTITAAVFVNDQEDVYLDNNSYSMTQVVVGSYDPNNKLNNPPGVGEEGQMLPTNDAFTYTVNFQNTGTAPAFTVRVEDQLDTDLDWSSFEMVHASHDYYVQIENGKLTWTFNNIMLPDSATDEPGSHGQIVYRIRPVADKPVGTVFENTAHIYFDFNEAIITNTTKNTFVEVVSVQNDAVIPGARLYPNPASSFFTVESPLLNGKAWIQIFDLNGRAVSRHNVTAHDRVTIPSELPAGQYILQIINGTNIQNIKLLVK